MKEKPLMSRMLVGALATLGALTATAALALYTAALDKEVAATEKQSVPGTECSSGTRVPEHYQGRCRRRG